jgi:hypothetical protein
MQRWRCGKFLFPLSVLNGELSCQRGKRRWEEDRLLTDREVGVCIGGGDLVDAEFDYAGRNLTVEKDEGAGHAQPLGKGHRHVSIAAAVPSARHRRVPARPGRSGPTSGPPDLRPAHGRAPT